MVFSNKEETSQKSHRKESRHMTESIHDLVTYTKVIQVFGSTSFTVIVDVIINPWFLVCNFAPMARFPASCRAVVQSYSCSRLCSAVALKRS